MARRLLVDLAPLRAHPDYRNLWLGQLVSQFGRQATMLALPYQVYALTSSPLAIGGLALATLVALVLFAIPAGGLADSFDRRRLLLIAQGGQIGVSIGFVALAMTPAPPLVLLYALAFVGAAITSIDRPARRSSVPRLVAPERLASALVLDSAIVQLAKIAGPAAAGLLIVWLGLPWVFALEAVLFSVGLLLILRLPGLPPLGGAARVTAQTLVDGLRFVRRTPAVLGSFAIDLSAMVFGLPVALFPILARDVFGGGADVLGLLVAAPTVGAVMGTLASGWIGQVEHQGRGVVIAVAVWALAIIGFGLSLGSLPLSLLLLAVAGGADIVSTVFRGSIIQLAVPDAMRGRISGVQLLIFQGGPRLGDIEATTVAAFAGAPFSVISGGVACLLGALVVARRFPALAAFRAPVDRRAQATATPASEQP